METSYYNALIKAAGYSYAVLGQQMLCHCAWITIMLPSITVTKLGQRVGRTEMKRVARSTAVVRKPNAVTSMRGDDENGERKRFR